MPMAYRGPTTVRDVCGRLVLSSAPDELARYFAAELPGPPPQPDRDRTDKTRSNVTDANEATHVTHVTSVANGPNYNLAPTAEIYLVRRREQRRILGLARWGLVPPWSKDPAGGARMINARAETVALRSSFRAAFQQRRCLIPADGFYEWTTVPGHKKRQPWYIHRPDPEPYAFAGLWELWRDPAHRNDDRTNKGWLRTCCIITAAANPKMARLHDRMPVVLDPAVWDQWLDPAEQDPERLSSLLQPTPASLVAFHPVSVQVNDARAEGPGLITPIEHIDPDGRGQPSLLFDPGDGVGAPTGRGDGPIA